MVPFFYKTPDWNFILVPVIIYVISYDIGPDYNSTELYLRKSLFNGTHKTLST